MKGLLLSLALLAISGVGLKCAAKTEPMDSIRECVRLEYFSASSSSEATEWVTTLLPDGRWPDIDYTDSSRSAWQLEKHLDRIAVLAGAGYDDAAIRALKHWYDGHYHNENWWYEKIGMPRRLLACAYLLDHSLDDALRDKLSRLLDAIDSSDFPARPGGDRIQVLSNHAKVLLWRRDYKGVERIFRLIEAEAAFAPMEEKMFDATGGDAVRNSYRPSGRGFQSDKTFHHRGDRVNSTLTYGLEIPEFYNYWYRLLEGSPWQFGPESREFVNEFVGDVVRWHLVRDKYVEPSAYNRELARPVTHSVDLHFSDTTKLSGARYFPQSGYFAFKRPTFETAVRFHSERNANQEAPHNQEGIRNHFRGDGVCHLSVTGREYLNIWPLFDFRYIPGTTVPLVADSILIKMPVQILDSQTAFAGAVTDNNYGACAFDFISERYDMRARKSWLFFDEGYVCLGSGITSRADVPIITSIEQCHSSDGSFVKLGNSYIHDGNLYTIITPGTAADASVTDRTGSWANCLLNAAQASVIASGDIFNLYIDHGVNPHNASYAYSITSATDNVEPWFEILWLSETAHCVASKDMSLIYCVFFQPGAVATPKGCVSVDRPCILMIRDDEIFVADPTHKLDGVKIIVEKDNGQIYSAIADMPKGAQLGTTTKIDMKLQDSCTRAEGK